MSQTISRAEKTGNSKKKFDSRCNRRKVMCATTTNGGHLGFWAIGRVRPRIFSGNIIFMQEYACRKLKMYVNQGLQGGEVIVILAPGLCSIVISWCVK